MKHILAKLKTMVSLVLTLTMTASLSSMPAITAMADENDNEDENKQCIQIQKVDSEDTVYVLEGATFRVYGTPDPSYGFTVQKTDGEDVVTGAEFTLKNSDSDTVQTLSAGTADVSGLYPGTYTLTETKAPEGYDELNGPISIVISDSGDLSASSSYDDYVHYESSVLSVLNFEETEEDAEPDGEVDEDEQDDEDNDGPDEPIIPDGFGNTASGSVRTETHDPVDETLTTGEDGIATISETLPKGTYYIEEAMRPEGYEEYTHTITFNIGEDLCVHSTYYECNSCGKIIYNEDDSKTHDKTCNGASTSWPKSNSAQFVFPFYNMPHNSGTVAFPVSIVWDDDDNASSLRPDDLSITLYRNGKITGQVFLSKSI